MIVRNIIRWMFLVPMAIALGLMCLAMIPVDFLDRKFPDDKY